MASVVCATVPQTRLPRTKRPSMHSASQAILSSPHLPPHPCSETEAATIANDESHWGQTCPLHLPCTHVRSGCGICLCAVIVGTRSTVCSSEVVRSLSFYCTVPSSSRTGPSPLPPPSLSCLVSLSCISACLASLPVLSVCLSVCHSEGKHENDPGNPELGRQTHPSPSFRNPHPGLATFLALPRPQAGPLFLPLTLCSRPFSLLICVPSHLATVHPPDAHACCTRSCSS